MRTWAGQAPRWPKRLAWGSVACLAWWVQGGVDVATAQPAFSPGVYGRVLPEADAPPPPVLNARPVQVRSQGAHRPSPVLYLHVPAAEARHWPQHCARHQACSAQVFFVDGERWAAQRRQTRLVHTEAAQAPSLDAADTTAPTRLPASRE